MTIEEIKKLEQGTLIKIKGNGFFGKVNRLVRFDSERVYDCTNKGYMLGSTLYPFAWISVATRYDYTKELKKATEDYNARIKALNDAWEKAKKYRG